MHELAAYAFWGAIGWALLALLSYGIQFFYIRVRLLKAELAKFKNLQKRLNEAIAEAERIQSVYEKLIAEFAGAEDPGPEEGSVH